MVRKILLALAALVLLCQGRPAAALDLENTLYLDLQWGRVVIEMRPDLAPAHVTRIKELVRQGFYDGLTFHRVMEGFMAQTGDPSGTGSGGSGTKLPAEFSGEPFVRGVVGMARAVSRNSADSQFFIMLASSPSLDGQYTIWGRVVEGMQHVDRITKAPPGDPSGRVPRPDKIERMMVAADAKK